ncbi:MAG: DegT/DnrJ/EryC1/StrS family aminotransferase [Patescibacteria group bacterium]|nr:DegT/DnrJ/EryC1/StrS family aminotransferase [Patescibacteria group bacterium]
MPEIISIDIVPNFENDDHEIIKGILQGKKYDTSALEKEAREILARYFPNAKVYFFKSARSALTFLLSSLENRSAVITQAFSCIVVPNAIKFAGLRPIYVDIDESFNISIEDLKRKIKEEVQAIVIQNTFGLPAKMDEIMTIAKENNLVVIENLTHSLGAKFKNNYLGNFGDVALLSFNRNKVISSIVGGALVVNNQSLISKLDDAYEKINEPSGMEIKKILLTGVVLFRLKRNYNFLTKSAVKLLRKFKMLNEMVSEKEKLGQKPYDYLKKLPGVLMPLLVNQLKKLERFNQHRQLISSLYKEAGLETFKTNNFSQPIFLRFPLLTEKRIEIVKLMKKEKIYLGDWYNFVLIPYSDPKNFDYQVNSCPKAEQLGGKVLNLPTHIDVNEKIAEKIIDIVKRAGR